MPFKKGQKAWNKNIKCPQISTSLKKFYLTKKGKQKKEKSKKIIKKTLHGKNKQFNGKKISNGLIKKYKSGMKHWTQTEKYTKEEIKNKLGKHIKDKTWEEYYGVEKAREMKEKLSVKIKGKYIGVKNPSKRTDVKRKQREGAIKYVEKIRGKCSPNIGKNEKQLLDEFELNNNCKLIRQYYIKNLGYFVDGYWKEQNVIIEVDEKPKINERDIRREKEIKEELNCKFIRIKDY